MATSILLIAIVTLSFFLLRSHLIEKGAAALKGDNYSEAAASLRMAADMGDSTAQRLMGDLSALGWGVPKSDDDAIKWYRRAGPDGESSSDPAAPAMYYIGKKYLGGEGVPRDESEARKWLQRSANGGYPKASQQLAQMPSPAH